MKKASMLATAMLLALVGSLQAQTTRGSFAFGLHNFSPLIPGISILTSHPTALGIGFGSYKSEESGTTETEYSYAMVGLNGSGHYFVIDNLSAGLNLHFLSYHEKEKNAGNDPDNSSYTLFLAGPEIRYYFPLGPKTKIWLHGGGSIGRGKGDEGDEEEEPTKSYVQRPGKPDNQGDEGDEEEEPTKLSRFGGGAGLAIFPVQQVSIDIGLGYSVYKSKDSFEFGGDRIEIKDTNSGLAVDVGFSVFF